MMKPRLLLSVLTLLFSASVLGAEPAALVRGFVDAFNRHNVDGMIELTTPDIRWMSVSGAAIEVSTEGRDELRAAMSNYFADTATTHSELRALTVSGPFVQVVEEASWEADDGERSQCSMAIYAVTDDGIRDVWYFPAHPCS